jgi:UDP-N-acetylmuramate--alanine ligase
VNEAKSLHFIGACGIGMQGLVRLSLQKGFTVSGSDRKNNQFLMNELVQLGMSVISEEENLDHLNPDIVVYSSAININHPQYQWASLRKKLWHRSQCLAFYFHQYLVKIAVTGTHGKTTVSSWLAYLLFHLKNAGCCVGGYIEPIGLTAWSGQEYFIIEADESDGSLDQYKSDYLVITNLEADHLDFWQNSENLFSFMRQYSQNAPQCILCLDDPQLSSWDFPAITYGFHPQADLRVLHYRSFLEGSQFEVTWYGQSIGLFETSLWGHHNILNAAAVITVALMLKCEVSEIQLFLKGFQGARRRLERVGKFNQMQLYDDYAHHPNEVASTLKAVREALGDVVLRVIFQPHRASRLKFCMDEFINSFALADQLWICPVYLAGESPIEGASHSDLVNGMKIKYPLALIREFDSLNEVVQALRLDPSCDLCLTMGAGDVTEVTRRLL